MGSFVQNQPITVTSTGTIRLQTESASKIHSRFNGTVRENEAVLVKTHHQEKDYRRNSASPTNYGHVGRTKTCKKNCVHLVKTGTENS
jgi:hypothetical protein